MHQPRVAFSILAFCFVYGTGALGASESSGGASTGGLAVSARADAYWHWVSTLSFGRGLRLNNPFRLSTPLGSSKSLAISAPYFDLGLGGLVGDPDGFQQGGVVRLSVAASGVSQEVVTPSYIGLYRFRGGKMLFGRVGAPVVLRPDANFGGEIGAGGLFLVQAGWGLSAEASYSHFFGAATAERSATAVGVMACQAGLWFDYEVLP